MMATLRTSARRGSARCSAGRDTSESSCLSRRARSTGAAFARRPGRAIVAGVSAPVTLEGWYVLHELWAIDWPRWNAADEAERRAAIDEARELLEAQAHRADGQSGCWTMLAQKADLCLLHWRRDLESLREEEVALARTRLRAFLVPAYSYLSVVELGTYELAAHGAARLKSRGIEPGSAGYDAALEAELRQL